MVPKQPTRMYSVFLRLCQDGDLGDALWDLRSELLENLHADQIAVYRKVPDADNLVCWFHSRGPSLANWLEIEPVSVVGYVALTGRSVGIEAGTEREDFLSEHPELQFDRAREYDRKLLKRSMLVMPIQSAKTLLGVLEIVGPDDDPGHRFGEEDLRRCNRIAEILGLRLSTEFGSAEGPFAGLVKRQLITAEELSRFQTLASSTGVSVAHMLRTEGGVEETDVGRCLEHYYGVPFVMYDPALRVDRRLSKNLNRGYLIRNRWLPIGGDPDNPAILIDDPADEERLLEIRTTLGVGACDVHVAIAEDILRMLGVGNVAKEKQSTDRTQTSLEAIVSELSAEEEETRVDMSGGGPTELLDENAPTVIQLVSNIILDAIHAGASDIHIAPGKGAGSATVRMRVDGVCRETLRIPHSHIRAVITRIKVMANLDITDSRLPQDGKATVRLENELHELRVAIVPTVNGESAVLRVLMGGATAMPLEVLNFSDRNLHSVRNVLKHPQGLVLVTGPTGSGKTTTLHALLGVLNVPGKTIWTAEDPVEITQAGMSQLQVNSRIGLTFSRALRSFLRADPDIILIGEMRDHETVSTAIEASLTGHLVLSTLHTNSASETVSRLLNMGIDPLNFADALIAVLSQRLVRTLCSECRTPFEPDEPLMQRYARAYGCDSPDELDTGVESPTFFQARGCRTCGNTGYKGRTGVHELLLATPTLKDMISAKATVADVRRQALADGMQTLMQDGIRKIFLGQIDLDQLRTVVYEGE